MDFTLPSKQDKDLPLPIARLVLNLPRSCSLNDHRHSVKRSDIDTNDDQSSDASSSSSEEEERWCRRSSSVGKKEDNPHVTFSFDYHLQNKVHPDTSRMTETPPLLFNHEIHISNQYGIIHALAIRGSILVIGTSHCNLNAFDIQAQSETFLAPPGIPPPIMIPVTEEPTLTDAIRSVGFPPTFHPTEDSKIIWAGTENGCLLVKHLETNDTLSRKITEYPILFLLRQQNMEVWTIDREGQLTIWPLFKNEEGRLLHPFSDNAKPDCFTVPSHVDHALLECPNKLWMIVGSTLVYFDRLKSTTLTIPLPTKAYVLMIPFYSDWIFTVSEDGQVDAWQKSTLEHKRTLSVHKDQVTSVTHVGTYYVWVGYRHGMIVIYDTRPEPWVTIKAWKAHTHSVTHVVVDEFSKDMAVVSMDSEGHMAVWDGLLSEHWLEQQMISRTSTYAELNPIQVMVCSWNMNAAKPESLTELDKEKIHEWLHGMENPDIIMIGVQEIVNLASKKFTARSILSSNRKFETIQEADDFLTHRYMLWCDYFQSIIETNFQEDYTVFKTDQLVGLFSCLFVKKTLESRIQQCDSTLVKTGFRVMNTIHGNKGGIAIRLILDDTSFCFVNCHLASGQSNCVSRNADLAGILHSARFPTFVALGPKGNQDPFLQQALFRPHSDGSCILDHEACFISGDFNYRIDMGRQEVLYMLQMQTKLASWESLLREDQLKKQLADPLFCQFKEAPILFDPTYKYDKNTNEYDRSEKKRIPAWCDRILYRAPVTITNEYYRRHEVRVSDHRPISAGFTVSIKKVDHARMEQTKTMLKVEWEVIKEQLLKEKKVHYVKQFNLCDKKEALDRLEKTDWDIERVVMDLFRDKGLCLS